MTRFLLPGLGGSSLTLAVVLLLNSRVEPMEPLPPLPPAPPDPVLKVPTDADIPEPPRAEPPPVHPLAHLSGGEISARVRTDLTSLGPLSVGLPNRGALLNGVAFPEGPLWHVVEPKKSYGTSETVNALRAAIEMVNQEFPNTPRLYVGQISAPRGGYLRPHRSHQSGRDVDVGYYYRGGEKWYQRATRENLDVPRTWALLAALFRIADVELVFMDHTVEEWLFDYALGHGEDPNWLRAVFEGDPALKNAVIRHTWGHLTHFHVRFLSPVARESGWRAYPALVKERLVPGSGMYARGTASWR